MSFFGGGGGDPFDMFGDMHNQMRHQMHAMDRMMSGMMDPFGFGFGGMGGGPFMDPRLAIESGAAHARHGQQQQGGRHGARHEMMQQEQQQQQQNALAHPFMGPFGGGLFGGGGGGLFGGMMRQMENMHRHAENDPNSHMYSQSTVISIDGTGQQPHYYESTNSVRKHGDVKEVRKTERNTASGQDKMSIGHHIGDRAHYIEKKRNRGGDVRAKQRFVNVDEKKAEDFDREFMQRAKRNTGRAGLGQFPDSRRHQAIESAPIITLPEDDDEPHFGHTSNSRRPRNGPIIEEI